LASSQDLVDSITAQTLRDANEYLETARGLELIRDSLSDELSYMSDEFLSSMSGPETQPTLLEDLETLQRNLKELESVKSYVRVIHRALSLRCGPNQWFESSRAYAVFQMSQRSCHTSGTELLLACIRVRLWALAHVRFTASRQVFCRRPRVGPTTIAPRHILADTARPDMGRHKVESVRVSGRLSRPRVFL